MKKAILIVGIILAVAAISAGSFWGGMKYQESQVSQAQANFFAARGQGQSGVIQGNGQFPGNGQMPPDRQGTFFRNGGGTIGQIKSIDGEVITLSTAENVTTINLTADTVIRQTVTASLTDLQPGMRVTVIGEKDNDGNITATQIQVVDESMIRDMPAPSGTVTVP
jgi:hypothetical protein